MSTPDFTKIPFAVPKTTSADIDTSVWQTPEGIDIKSAYCAADSAPLDFTNTYPGFAPYVRGPYPTMFTQSDLGQSGNMRAFRPPRIVMHFTDAGLQQGKRVYLWLSISRPTVVMIATIRVCRAM